MDILYILGDGSAWNDNELKYSLRSIARFGRGVGNVYLAGTHKPAFVGGRVHFLHVPNPKLGASRNIATNITEACRYFQLGDFLLSSDDHFYVKPTDFDKYPVYLKGELPDKPSAGIYGDATYTQTLVNTRLLLDVAGLPHKNYAHHANQHFNGERWLALGSLLKLALQLENGVETVSLYLNAFGKHHAAPTPRKDCKIQHARNAEDVLAQVGERECFSIYDSAISEGVADLLARLFPEKCIYER